MTSLLFRRGVLAVLFMAAGLTANAQFKEIKEAPFPAAVAHRRIAALLEAVNAGNRDQTVATISGWLDWYRDVLDDEMIAHWKGSGRANLTLVMAPLADARIALQVVDFSWREQRQETFNLAYAPMLGDLMARYPESAKPFLSDLLGPATFDLPQPVAQAVCRILLDMPDIGTWRRNALQILPRYRQVADSLLRQDLNGPDQERVYRALRWRTDLKLDGPAVTVQRQPRTSASRTPLPGQTTSDAMSQRPHIVEQPSAYNGPRSGTFESSGEPIPQNGEYVFTNIPPVKLLLDFDTKHWEARLQPGEGHTQVLVLRNIGRGPQKRCVVHWSVMP